MEIWKDIDGYEGIYQVSNLGNVKSCERVVTSGLRQVKVAKRMMSACKNNKGYPVVLLSKAGKYRTHSVHRLVAESHIPNPNNYTQVNHKDGIKHNNNSENLEWCTCTMNIQHAYATGLITLEGRAPTRCLRIIHTPTGRIYNSIKEAAEHLHINYKTLHFRLRKNSKRNTLQYLKTAA